MRVEDLEILMSGKEPEHNSSISHIVEQWRLYFIRLLKTDAHRISGVELPLEWREQVPEGLTEEQEAAWKSRCRHGMTVEKFGYYYGDRLPPRY